MSLNNIHSQIHNLTWQVAKWVVVISEGSNDCTAGEVLSLGISLPCNKLGTNSHHTPLGLIQRTLLVSLSLLSEKYVALCTPSWIHVSHQDIGWTTSVFNSAIILTNSNSVPTPHRLNESLMNLWGSGAIPLKPIGYCASRHTKTHFVHWYVLSYRFPVDESKLVDMWPVTPVSNIQAEGL